MLTNTCAIKNQHLGEKSYLAQRWGGLKWVKAQAMVVAQRRRSRALRWRAMMRALQAVEFQTHQWALRMASGASSKLSKKWSLADHWIVEWVGILRWLMACIYIYIYLYTIWYIDLYTLGPRMFFHWSCKIIPNQSFSGPCKKFRNRKVSPPAKLSPVQLQHLQGWGYEYLMKSGSFDAFWFSEKHSSFSAMSLWGAQALAQQMTRANVRWTMISDCFLAFCSVSVTDCSLCFNLLILR